MAEQLIVWTFLLLIPFRVTAINTADLEAIQQEVIEIEAETRAYRQKKSGHGL